MMKVIENQTFDMERALYGSVSGICGIHSGMITD